MIFEFENFEKKRYFNEKWLMKMDKITWYT